MSRKEALEAEIQAMKDALERDARKYNSGKIY